MKAKKYTAAQWCKALVWCEDFLGIRDWRIALNTKCSPPEGLNAEADFGTAVIVRRDKTATIYIQPPNCLAGGKDPMQTLFHEMLHIAFADLNIPAEDQGDDYEFLIRRLEKAMLAAYRKGVT